MREDFEQLLDRAVDAFNANDFAQSREMFLRAYALRPSARLQRGIGMASLRLELYAEARDMLSAALDNAERPLTASQRDEVSQQLAWMQANLGTVQLRWIPHEPRQYELRVDDKLQPHSLLVLAPGTHQVTISGPTIETSVHTVEARASVETVLSCTWKLRAAEHTSGIDPAVAARTLDESSAEGMRYNYERTSMYELDVETAKLTYLGEIEGVLRNLDLISLSLLVLRGASALVRCRF